MAAAPFLVVLVLYLGACVALGAFAARRARGEAFLTAGRGLGTVLVVASLITAWTGAGSVVGGVSFAFAAGLGYLWLAGDILGVAALIGLAPTIRRVGRFTVPEILERRYGPGARVASALVAFVAYTAIAGTQSLAGGTLLNVALDVPLGWGVAIFAATFIAYTALGGLLGLAWVGLFQGVLMFAGLLALLVAGTWQAGGPAAVLAAQPPAAFAPLAVVGWANGLSLLLATALLLVADQSTWQRFFAARDERTAGVSARGFLVLVVALNLFFLALGLVARAVVPESPANEASLRLVSAALGTWGAAFVFAAFAAIVMSTASAYFLSASSNVVKDVAQRFLPAAARGGDAAVAWMTRATLVVVAVGAVALALSFPSVLRLALFSYYVYATGVAVPVLAALFWRRATAAGAVASVAAGFAVVVAWTAAGSPFGLEPFLPALAAAVAALVGVSLLTPAPAPAAVEPFAGPPGTPGARAGRAVGAVFAASGLAALLFAYAALPRPTAALALLAAALLLASAPLVAARRGAFGARLAGVEENAPERLRRAGSAWLVAEAAVAVAGAAYHAAFGNLVGAVVLGAAAVLLLAVAHTLYHGAAPAG